MEEVNCKDQKITFCAHHQNGIIENKIKMLTLSARTLLFHGMRLWPQMIDTMFLPFAFKAATERHNCLSFNKDGKTPISILHDIASKTITVKSFHTLYCPVYVLYLRAQSAGGPGPPKWEPRSCIGVYLGHSPFHAGSVALVFNPRTGRVSPQYHVVFDDTFATIPFMDNGTVPPHWADLHKHSTERATNEEFNLAEEWMKEMPDQVDVPMAGSRLTDPFALIPDQNQAPTLASNNTFPEASVTLPASEKANKRTSASVSSSTSTAAPSSQKARKLDTNDVVRIRQSNNFDSPASAESSSSQLTLSPRINLYKAGLCRLPRFSRTHAKCDSLRKGARYMV